MPVSAELRLLKAEITSGINESDFLRQVARVRAAYDGAKANLSSSAKRQFAEIEFDITACTFFWDEQIRHPPD
jgi:hypothetical protein